MARPKPIIVSSSPLSSETQAISASLSLGPLVDLFRKRKEEEAKAQEEARVGQEQKLLATEAIARPQAAQFDPFRIGAPPGETRPFGVQTLTTPEEITGRQRASQFSLASLLAPKATGERLLEEVLPTAAAPEEVKIAKDVGGFQRFVTGPKAGQRAFPEAQAPEEEPEGLGFADPAVKDFTKESIELFEETGLASSLVPKPEKLQGRLGGKSAFDAENTLRDDFLNQSKTFIDVRDSFARVEESSKDPSAAGDLALIFNFMKMLDPASVVREGEFATAQNATGVPDRIKNIYNKVATGERLNKKQRKDFVGRAEQFFTRQDAQHKQREKIFGDVAKRNKLDTRNVVIDLNDPIFVRQKRIDALERKETE